MLSRPGALDELLLMMREPDAKVLAGGTDIYPAVGDRLLEGRFIDPSGVAGIRGIVTDHRSIRIGAMTTWTDIVKADLPPALGCLKAAARQVGSIQIQNRATLAGNLCNASPAADGVPALLALDAEVELISSQGARRLPVGRFITGNRRTERAPDELLSAIIVPCPSANMRTTFLKLGARRYLVISIIMVAISLEIDQGNFIRDARIAIGACSPVATRLESAEARLIGQVAGPDCAHVIGIDDFEALSPIDDSRATALYRRRTALHLTRRAIIACIAGQEGGMA